MKQATRIYYLKLNKVQKAKFDLDLAHERNDNGGVNLPDPDGAEYKLVNGTYYQNWKVGDK